MKSRRHSREDAVPNKMFHNLYNGALKIDDPEKRLIATTFVLLTARLKLRISEAIHFHEGWLVRDYGLIRIPAFEPCTCKYCWKQAKRNHNDEDPYESALERHYHERYRSKNRRVRFIPYLWSPRIIACLEAYVDKIGVYSKHSKTAERLLPNHILPNTDFFEPNELNWRGMRATGDTFWSFTELGIKERAEIGGHREAELGTYSGRSPVQLANETRIALQKKPLDMSKEDLVTMDPRPLPREPFPDPREIDPKAEYDPYKFPPKLNPRSEVRDADQDFDSSKFDSLSMDKDLPSAKELHASEKRFKHLFIGDESEEEIDPYAKYHEEKDDNSVLPGQPHLTDFNDRGTSRIKGMLKAGYMMGLVNVAWLLTLGSF